MISIKTSDADLSNIEKYQNSKKKSKHSKFTTTIRDRFFAFWRSTTFL
jgi:hypothetical protein